MKTNLIGIALAILSISILSTPISTVWAQGKGYGDFISLFDLRMYADQSGARERWDNDPEKVKIRATYQGPEEPVIPPVQFYEFPKPTHLQGQAESLVHGITITLPPEYDHYGYELRRYMKSVGNHDIFTNRSALVREQRNIEKAKIVFKYWRKMLNQETAAIENRIKNENADSKSRTIYKLNAGIVRAFMIETQSWINANNALLQFIADNQGKILFENGKLRVKGEANRATFISLYNAREKARWQMHQYDPFRQMVY